MLGVAFDDRKDFYEPEDEFEFNFSSGIRQLAIVTQNVDSLHEKAGSRLVMPIHGKGRILKCMDCGYRLERNDFHVELESLNQEWLSSALKGYEKASDLRPDGDAVVKDSNYNDVCVPSCPKCKTGFCKFVFFVWALVYYCSLYSLVDSSSFSFPL